MSTVNSIELKVNLRKNNNEKSDQFGKYYAELERKRTLSLKGLAKHISDHGTPFTRDIVEGVVTRLRNAIVFFLSSGRGIKLDSLGTLVPTIENKTGGADSAREFNVTENVVGVHIRFIPEGEELDRITSRQMKEKCTLRKTYEVSFKTITHGGKSMQIPVFTPIIEQDPQP
jgi:predicted histone-like DNA-binding protein